MTLKYPPFANNARIGRAAVNSPPMASGEQGAAVAILQGALIDLGYPMPISTKLKSRPDGIYGNETRNVVVQFQTDQSLLKKDGIAGHDTFEKLDKLLGSGPPKPPSPPSPPPAPPQPIPFPSTNEYEIGSGDPPIGHDPGAGPWNSTPTTVACIAEKQAIIQILPIALAYPGRHAVDQMEHYLGNTGRPFTIDLEAMVKDVPSAKTRFENEVAEAKAFVEMLPVGVYQIRSKQLEQGYNHKNESADWFFAVGGYSTWGVGQATIRQTSSGVECELNFEYRFYDRYNWDAGKSVTIAGIKITDQAMGEFHRQGLAQEYDVNGSLKRTFRWKKGAPIPPQQFQPSGGR